MAPLKSIDREPRGSTYILNNIRAVRLDKKISQREVAERVGIARPFYSQMESGSRRMNLDYFLKIAEVLGVHPNVLVDGYGDVIKKELDDGTVVVASSRPAGEEDAIPPILRKQRASEEERRKQEGEAQFRRILRQRVAERRQKEREKAEAEKKAEQEQLLKDVVLVSSKNRENKL